MPAPGPELDKRPERTGDVEKAPRALRPLLVSAGVLSVALGVVGIFVPLLPTTPFLLLAAACFLRSSDRFHTWLMTNRWVGDHLRDYMEHRSTTLTTKVVSLTTLWLFIGLAGIFFTESLVVRSILLVVAVGVTIHLVSLKTLNASSRGVDRTREDARTETKCDRDT
jgi:uncharacterized membrane protein YbaN (DUF454 family)